MEYDSTRHRLAPGTQVGDHLIVRGVLGEGGTAVVYEALHTRLGASVALKVVDVSEEYMEGARARLLREAHVCASLEDLHIPRVYDVGALEDGTPYVVMERVSGRTLEDVLRQGALPLDVAVHIVDDLLLAVEAVEKAGVVHRDIKPPNIILQTTGEGTLRVRLMDFGVSKTLTSDADPVMQNNPKLTQQGAIVGTPHYMAPEQIVGPSVDTRADLYAVGVVAYEIMGGRTPFEGQTTGEVVAAVLHTRPLPLSKLCKVHPELEGWVERAMAPRRTDRFASARAMRDALREAWSEQQAFSEATGRSKWRRPLRLLGAVSLVTAAVVVPWQAGYDLSAVQELFSRGEPDELAPAEPADEPAPATAETAAAPDDVDMDLTPEAVDLTADPAGSLSEGSSDVGALGAAEQPEQPEEEPPPPALPQSEPLRAEAAAAAKAAKAEAAAADAGAQPGSAEVANRAGAGARRPQPQRAAPRPPRALATPPTEAPAPEPAPRGVLLNDYLKQLDSRLAPPPEPAPREREEGKRPGRPAPNPFDQLPENPYSQ